MRLAPDDQARAAYRNTLGLILYRWGRFREAIDSLRPNLKLQTVLAMDLYLLAMSHSRFMESEQAQAYLDLARRAHDQEKNLPASEVALLANLRAEATALIEE